MKCPRCGDSEFKTIRMYNQINKTFKNVCANCDCVYPVMEVPKQKWYSRTVTYLQFLIGAGCLGGRAYVIKKYGIDIGSKPSNLKSFCKKFSKNYIDSLES